MPVNIQPTFISNSFPKGIVYSQLYDDLRYYNCQTKHYSFFLTLVILEWEKILEQKNLLQYLSHMVVGIPAILLLLSVCYLPTKVVSVNFNLHAFRVLGWPELG